MTCSTSSSISSSSKHHARTGVRELDLVGEELAVSQSEVGESRHATEDVHQTVSGQFRGRQVQLVNTRSFPLDRLHMCILQTCTAPQPE